MGGGQFGSHSNESTHRARDRESERERNGKGEAKESVNMSTYREMQLKEKVKRPSTCISEADST